MAVLPVLVYPDRILKTVCPLVDSIDGVQSAIDDLIDTMDAGPPRTVGIAAPQIGSLTRIAIVHSDRNPKYPGGNGFLVLVNPVILEREGQQTFREGCLSIPDYTANIRRAEHITVGFLNRNGEAQKITAAGFESVVLQHEIDHLDGVLFLDRVADIKTDLFRRRQ